MTETESKSKKEAVLVVDKEKGREKEDYYIAGMSEGRVWMKDSRLKSRLEEFKALRNEIITTISAQYHILQWGTTVLAALFAAGIAAWEYSKNASMGCFLITSFLALAFLTLWMAEEARRIRAAFYIRRKLEDDLCLGWEKFLRSSHGSWKDSRDRYGVIAFKEHYGLMEVGTLLILLAFSIISLISATTLAFIINTLANWKLIVVVFDVALVTCYLILIPEAHSLVNEEKKLGERISNPSNGKRKMGLASAIIGIITLLITAFFLAMSLFRGIPNISDNSYINIASFFGIIVLMLAIIGVLLLDKGLKAMHGEI